MMAVTFGEWLRTEMTKRKVSGSEIAQACGISRTAVSDLRYNRIATPRKHIVEGIARALGVSVDNVVAAVYNQEPDAASNTTEIAASSASARSSMVDPVAILQAFALHPAETQRKWLEMIRATAPKKAA